MNGARKTLLVEFATADALLAAVARLRDAGYRKMDTFTPYPVHGLEEALALRPSRLPWFVLAGGLLGAAGGYFLQWFVAVFDYPLNVGGRPAHALPAFVPITFEMGVLGAALTAVVTLVLFAGLPRPWHPVFEVPGFERASIDRFWVAVDAGDPAFDQPRLLEELGRWGALRIEWTAKEEP